MNANNRKRRKVMVCVFGGLCALLAIDRLFLSGTTSAVDEAEASPAPPIAAPAAPVPPEEKREEVHPRLVAERLENFRASHPFEISELPDIFAAPEWARSAPVQPAISPAQEDSAEEFRTAHRLTAVISGGSQAGIILDEVFVKVGEEVDGYVLRSTTERSATFIRGQVQIRLELPHPEM